MAIITIDTDKLNWCKMTGTQLGWVNEVDISNAIVSKPCEIRPKGEWLTQQEINGDDYFKAWDIAGVLTYATRYKCNKCEFIQTCIEDHGQYNFCPNCGADMRGKKECENN